MGATSGTHAVFISGSGDTVNLSGGSDTITDTGTNNTYVLPVAGQGSNAFSSDILAIGDQLDLTACLAATTWNGQASTLANYVSVADTPQGATVLISAKSGGSGVAVATLNGATGLTLTNLLAHAIT